MYTGSAAYFDILPFARTAFVLQEGEADGREHRAGNCGQGGQPRWQQANRMKSLWRSSNPKRPRTTVTHHPAFTQLSGTGRARSTASTQPKLCARFTPAAIMKISTTRRVPLFWTTHRFQSCPESADSISIVAFRSSYSLHL